MSMKKVRGVPLSQFPIDGNHPLIKGAHSIDWEKIKNRPELFKQGFATMQPLRRMFGLLILESVRKVEGENLLAQWLEVPLLQHFTGETLFHWDCPVTANELKVFKSQLSDKGLAILEEMLEIIKVNMS